MKISFITTVFNESETIQKFLDSIFSQTTLPNEIIIVDGGSTDKTVEKINNIKLKFKDNKILLKILIKKGNRSVGRNEAIEHTTGNIIVCSDSGNMLDKDWIKNITEPFKNKNVDVVAGYYKGVAKTVFQRCVIPYALVMPDKVNSNNFLPATRSVAFRKNIWKKVGGFNENLTHNEDYAFAKALQKINAKIIFKKDAIVYWFPRNTFRQAFVMMYRFAYGDAEARIIRPKVILVFLRYLIGVILLVLFFISKSYLILNTLLFLLILYLLWAIQKNYKYVKQWQAMFILPALQLVADWAVLKGTVLGLLGRKISYN